MNSFQNDKLYFLPLGGAGHFGANLNVYIYNHQILIVDLGIEFSNKTIPGVDIILPDISFLEKNKEKIVGLVITHGHEDHYGAIKYLWPKLKCPLYSNGFTIALIQEKVKEKSWSKQLVMREIKSGIEESLGAFNLRFMRLTHSIPDHQAMIIRVPGYKPIFHTGDWKFDPEPVIGLSSDDESLTKLSKEGVSLYVGDSTNALEEGHSYSENDVKETLVDLFSRYKARIAVTCFCSNIARLYSIHEAARKNNREVVMVGRTLWQMDKLARQRGYFDKKVRFLSPKQANSIARDKIVILCTGSQGQDNAALMRIAKGESRDIILEKDDAVVFSSWTIPPAYQDVTILKNKLCAKGIRVIDHLYDKGVLHASGHNSRDESIKTLNLLKPDIVVPVHGELRMMRAHADLAEECGINQTIVPLNGNIIEIDAISQKGKIIDHIDTELMAVDGTLIVPVKSAIFRNRNKISFAGVVHVTCLIDADNNLLNKPIVSNLGVIEELLGKELLIEELMNILGNLFPIAGDSSNIEETVYRATRHYFKQITGKKPVTTVHIIKSA